MSWPCRRRVAARTARAGAPCHSAPAPYRRALLCRVTGALLRRYHSLYLCPLLRHKGHPQPRFNFCIATPPLARPHTRAATRPCAQAGSVVRVAGHIVVMHGLVTPPPPPPPPPGAPKPTCLLSLLCACSPYCVPAQPIVCPAQPSCVPTQPSVCHNTTKSVVCLLSLLCSTM